MEEITKTDFFKRANDGDTILPHWIAIDHDFNHKPVDFNDNKNPLFGVLKKLDDQKLRYFVFATEEGRGIKIIFSFKELLKEKNIDDLKRRIGNYIISLIGGELKLSGSQCSFCFPAKDGEEPIHAKTRKPLKIIHFTGLDNSLNEIKEQIKENEPTEIILGGRFTPIPYSERILESELFLLDEFKRFWRYNKLKGIWKEDAEAFIRNKLRTLLFHEDQQRKNYAEEIISYIKDSSWKNRGTEEPLNKICLKNGVLDLGDLTVEPHNPKYFFINHINVEYNPQADCPIIKKFLSEIVNEDDLDLIQEIIGYCLFKDYFIHKAIMLVGSGANGKSTFLSLLREFLGLDNVASVPLQFLENNRFAVSSLHGKLANIFADLSSRALTGTSIFKMLTGGDSVPAERKFKEQFFFVNYAKLLFSANQIPKSPEDTNAFFRRWVILNFPNEFYKNADKHLLKKLTTKKELSGLLNFALIGLKRLLENGDFANTKSHEEIRDQYVRMSDSVGAFVMDRILVNPDNYLEKKELYMKYCDYCREEKSPIEAENTFHRELQKKIKVEDYRPSLEREGKKQRVQCWKGISFSENNIDKNPDNPDMLDTFDKTEENVSDVNDVKVNSLLKQQKIDFAQSKIKEDLENG